jgi:secreted Zn-dependent insulinase-like peptidase
MRIALREANLTMDDEYELIMFIRRYLSAVEEISTQNSPDEFRELDLDYLEEFFDQFQKYVSEELKIIKKIDDDDFDESLCYFE